MVDYHHTVLVESTPYWDFPKWCEESHTCAVSDETNQEVQNARRKTLIAYIDAHFRGSVNAFATALERKQPQLNEMLRGNRSRSFGEKLALSLEVEVDELRRKAEYRHLPPLRFDSDSGATHPRLAKLIAFFEAIPSEESQELLVQIAGTMAQKSGEEAASTQVGRDSPARPLGPLQPRPKTAPKKHRRA